MTENMLFIQGGQVMEISSQSSRILKALRETKNGVSNFVLSSISLKYSSRISELRRDGHNIIAIRQYLPNGRATGTWKYYLGEDK